MNKEMIERIAMEVAKEMPIGFLWSEGCDHESGILEPEVCYFAEKFLARIDAERGKEARKAVRNDTRRNYRIDGLARAINRNWS